MTRLDAIALLENDMRDPQQMTTDELIAIVGDSWIQHATADELTSILNGTCRDADFLALEAKYANRKATH